MALYSASNQNAGTPQATATTYKTQLALTAATATLRRAFIYEFGVGPGAVPNATDCEVVYDLSAQTAVGTSTATTPVALDQADAASGTVGSVAFTAEGTITASSSRWSQGFNQRASYCWKVNPCGPGEIVIPATNVVGYAFRAKSSTYTGTVTTYAMFRE